MSRKANSPQHRHENFRRGNTGNIKLAEQQSESLADTARPITAHQQYINQRIETIRALTPEALSASRSDLFCKTEKLLTQTQKNGIIPEDQSAELLENLQKSCLENDSRRKSTEPVNTQPVGENSEMRAVVPENFLYRNLFPDIYKTLEQCSEGEVLCKALDSLLGKLYFEIDEVLPEIIKRIEKIDELKHQLDSVIQGIGAVQLPLSESHIINVRQLFSEFKKLINETKYAGFHFFSLDFMDQLKAAYPEKINQLFADIENFLSPLVNCGTDPAIRTTLPSASLMMPIYAESEKGLSRLVSSIEALEMKLLKGSKSPANTNFLEHYEKQIAAMSDNMLTPRDAYSDRLSSSIATSDNDRITSISDNVLSSTSQNARGGVSVSSGTMPASSFDSLESSLRDNQDKHGKYQETDRKIETVQDASDLQTSLINDLSDLGGACDRQEISHLCNNLFSGNLNADQMKAKLGRLMTLLGKTSYGFRYGGGELIGLVDGRQNTVPEHIARALYRHHALFEKAGTLAEVMAMRNEIFHIISEAAKKSPRCCFFFSLRDQATTQAIYDIMAASIPQGEDSKELKVICDKLLNVDNLWLDDEVKRDFVKDYLGALIQLLIDVPYQLRYRGGDWIAPAGQRPRKVPHHVRVVFDLYHREIRGANTLGAVMSLKDEIFVHIREAAENFSSRCCGLFALRDTGTTQAVYNTIARCTP